MTGRHTLKWPIIDETSPRIHEKQPSSSRPLAFQVASYRGPTRQPSQGTLHVGDKVLVAQNQDFGEI